MELENKIRSILAMEKFNNLTAEEKEDVFRAILANCLILSPKKQEEFLDNIKNHLVSIEDLKDNVYELNGTNYNGIVDTHVGKANPLNPNVYPFIHYLKYKTFPTPLGKMTKSIVHEFGHLVIKEKEFELTDTTNLIDLGGLIITHLLNNGYGHMISEIMNELTNLLSNKAYLSYTTPNPEREQKMKEFAEKMGITVEDSIDYLKVLPDDIFTNYSEHELANTIMMDNTKGMFNPLYVKYTPLVRLMLFVFQNPTCSYNDLKEEFEKGNGLSATKNGLPINDLLYGYYESSLHVQYQFDNILGQGTWERFNREFDSKMMDNNIDYDFITSSIELFTNFYNKRLAKLVDQGVITKEQAVEKSEELTRITTSCMTYYDGILERNLT